MTLYRTRIRSLNFLPATCLGAPLLLPRALGRRSSSLMASRREDGDQMHVAHRGGQVVAERVRSSIVYASVALTVLAQPLKCMQLLC